MYLKTKLFLPLAILPVMAFTLVACGGLGTSQTQTNPYRSSNFDDGNGYSSGNSRRQESAVTPEGTTTFALVGDATSPKRITQLLKELGDLTPTPTRVFFIGDQVELSKPDEFKTKLGEWSKAIKSSGIASKTKITPVFEGSETQTKEWLEISKRDGFDLGSNGPSNTPPNEDLLLTDQSKSSYSLEIKGTKFIVLNTETPTKEIDPVTKLPAEGWIPLKWLESEVRTAQGNVAIRSIFILGNRPIQKTAGGSPPIFGPQSTKIKELITSNSKVRAYFCGKDRVWETTNLGSNPGDAVQISIGNSTSASPKWSPEGGAFLGFSLIKVYSDGRVALSNYKSPMPKGEANVVPAQPAPEILLSPAQSPEKPKSAKTP